jgi:hypothetical protein
MAETRLSQRLWLAIVAKSEPNRALLWTPTAGVGALFNRRSPPFGGSSKRHLLRNHI